MRIVNAASVKPQNRLSLEMLKQRVITAAILAVVVIGTILWLDSFYLSLILALTLFFSISEMLNMTMTRSHVVQWLAATGMIGMYFWLLPYMEGRVMYYHSYVGLLMWVAILLYLFHYQYSGQWSLSMRLPVSVFSVLLLWICVNGLYFIHQHFEQGGWLLIYLLTLVWVADIGAYFSGKQFGKNKLAPGISPGKTREGVMGGLALNALWITLVYFLSAGWGMDYLSFLLLGLLTSAISVVGDLYESILKREAGLKDSGKILPGHGGVLDRIDSVIAATPVFLSGLYMLGAV